MEGGGAVESGGGSGVGGRAEKADPLLADAAEALDRVLGEAEREIGTLAGAFEELAQETNGALESAAKVLVCVEEERVQAVLQGVRRLEEETGTFLGERLRATAGILEAVKGEAELLRQLERQTQAQRGIARETEMLRVLTNIEVARLGTDLNMPNVDGIGLIAGARKLPGYGFTPILMLTTESQPEKKEAGRKVGATGWIVKPFQAEQLIGVVQKLVR